MIVFWCRCSSIGKHFFRRLILHPTAKGKLPVGCGVPFYSFPLVGAILPRVRGVAAEAAPCIPNKDGPLAVHLPLLPVEIIHVPLEFGDLQSREACFSVCKGSCMVAHANVWCAGEVCTQLQSMHAVGSSDWACLQCSSHLCNGPNPSERGVATAHWMVLQRESRTRTKNSKYLTMPTNLHRVYRTLLWCCPSTRTRAVGSPVRLRPVLPLLGQRYGREGCERQQLYGTVRVPER